MIVAASAERAWPARAQIESKPRCVSAEAVIVHGVDSATAVAGDAYAFKLSEAVPATRTTPDMAIGTPGHGIVSFADHAHGAGTPGRLALEPRYLTVADGSHVQVIADPQLAENFAQGATRNLNGALSFVPGAGLAVAGYNALHRGREVSIAKGSTFSLIIGDELAAGKCFVPSPDTPNIR